MKIRLFLAVAATTTALSLTAAPAQASPQLPHGISGGGIISSIVFPHAVCQQLIAQSQLVFGGKLLLPVILRHCQPQQNN